MEERTEEQDRAAEGHVDAADVEDHPVTPTGPRSARGRDPRGRLYRGRPRDRGRRGLLVARTRFDGFFDQ